MVETWNTVSLRHRRRAWRGWILIIIAIIAVVWSCLFGAARRSHAGEPIAYILCAGNGNAADLNEFPAQVRWENYAELAMRCGPIVKAAGIKRVFLHNPGGNFHLGWVPNMSKAGDPAPLAKAQKLGTDTRTMWVNQWLLAEQARLRFADRDALVAGHKLWTSIYDVDEVIYYVGDPADLRDAYLQGLDCVEPFLACGEGASVGFDLVAGGGTRWKDGDDICRLFTTIRSRGSKVYVEPRFLQLHVDRGLGKYVDGTVATAGYDANTAWPVNYKIQPGETIRDMQVLPGGAQAPDGITPMWRGADNWTRAAK